jgi:Protein of unknown function (DUF3303)
MTLRQARGTDAAHYGKEPHPVPRGDTMKYLVTWQLTDPSRLRAAADRFLENGGKPPEGATLVGRWFGTNRKGCAVLEASDPKPIFELVSQWQEFMQMEATPALEDDDAGAIFGKLYG